MPANEIPDRPPPSGLLDWLAPEQFGRALRRMEARWDLKFPDEGPFRSGPNPLDEEGNPFSTDDAVDEIYAAALAAGRVPPPGAGEAADDFVPAATDEIFASLAHSPGGDVPPDARSPNTTLRTLIPRRRRRTLNRLAADLGTEVWNGDLGPAGCGGCLTLALAAGCGAVWLVGAWMKWGVGASMTAGVAGVVGMLFLFMACHGSWRRWRILPTTVGDLARKTAEERAERLRRRHFSAEVHRLLVAALDDDAGDPAETES